MNLAGEEAEWVEEGDVEVGVAATELVQEGLKGEALGPGVHAAEEGLELEVVELFRDEEQVGLVVSVGLDVEEGGEFV